MWFEIRPSLESPLSTTTQELPFSREFFLFPKTKFCMMFPEVHNSAQLTELISSIGFTPYLYR